MCRGKDAIRLLPAVVVGLASFGCVLNGGQRSARWQQQPVARGAGGGQPARVAEPAGPITLAEPRPVQSPSSATSSLPSTKASQTIPAAIPQPRPSASTPSPVSLVSQPSLDPPPGPANDPLAGVRRLHEAAVDRYAGIESYVVRLKRREQINGKDQPEEIMSLTFRKQPWSVHFKWLNDPGKDREVVYVKGQHGNNIHTRLAAGDIPLMRGGMRIALPPDDPRVLAKSRHPITEAGVGAMIERIGELIAAQEKGDLRSGRLAYFGPQSRPDYSTPEGGPASLEGIEHTIPPGGDVGLAKGGRRQYFFDPSNGLPVLVVTHDDRGQEVEHYSFDRFLFNVKLDNDDFDPDKLWRKAP
jgi:hypothetical protein